MTNSDSEDMILEVENTPVKCKRQDLINHSDYFKAMLEGNFIESRKSYIKLEGVEVKAINVILSLLKDEISTISEEDVLSVLQAACMLQFINIRSTCLALTTAYLKPSNSIKIWLVTDQLSIHPLNLQAKTMALEEFAEIQKSKTIEKMELNQLISYLGHVNLTTKKEFPVFQAAMNWWYENFQSYKADSTKTLYKLLSCVDFKKLSQSEIKEIMLYPDIAKDDFLLSILNYALSILYQTNTSLCNRSKRAAEVLCSSQSRVYPRVPCLFANKFQRASASSDSNEVVMYRDKFKRKRFCKIVEDSMETNYVMYYDLRTKSLKALFDVDNSKTKCLDGFKLVGYKEFVFLFGGEYLIGKGNWNYNFWVYDTIRLKWERKCLLPFPRRHFECCLVGDYLYIIGGTATYRVIQENMFWYNFKENKWSSQIMLPCPGRQLKCCEFLGKLFVVNISNKCGYFFNQDSSLWIKMNIIDDDNLLTNHSEFAVFSYKDILYIKGAELSELKVKDKQLEIISNKNLELFSYEKLESVLCDNVLYTLYEHGAELDNKLASLEMYNLDTGFMDYVFKNEKKGPLVMEQTDSHILLSSSPKLFTFRHHQFAKADCIINENALKLDIFKNDDLD